MILFEPSPPVRAMIAVRLTQPVPEDVRHLVPLWRAVAESDVTFATVLQDGGRFSSPPPGPRGA